MSCAFFEESRALRQIMLSCCALCYTESFHQYLTQTEDFLKQTVWSRINRNITDIPERQAT